MKKVIIFDFDGVIVDSFKACLECMQLYDANLTSEEYSKMFEGNIYEALEEEYPSDVPLRDGKENINEDQIDFFEEYYKRIENINPVDGIEEVIKKFSEKPLYIVSSTAEDKINLYLTKYNLRQYFKRLMGPETSESKVEKLKLILELENIEQSEVIFITDTLGDLKEGEKAGIDAIGVTWGFHGREVLEKGRSVSIVENSLDLLAIITI